MKYKVTLKDGIELLITADKEVDAVRKAKDIKDALTNCVNFKDAFEIDGDVEEAKKAFKELGFGNLRAERGSEPNTVRIKGEMGAIKNFLTRMGANEKEGRWIFVDAVRSGCDSSMLTAGVAARSVSDSNVKDWKLEPGKTYNTRDGHKITVKSVDATVSEYNGEPGLRIHYDFVKSDGSRGSSNCSSTDFFNMMIGK